MLYYGKALRRLPSYALCRGICGNKIGVGGFQVFQLFVKLVIFMVGDLGLVFNIVKIVVTRDSLAQFFDFFFYI